VPTGAIEASANRIDRRPGDLRHFRL
jgi:hypothetical protein